MRFNNVQYLEAEHVTVSCRNAEASATILDGQPVFLLDAVNATNLGTDVVLTSNTNMQPGFTSGIAKWFKLAGTTTNLTGAQPGDVFEAICYGFTDAIITLRTRTSSTANWASVTGIAIGDQLIAESVANNLSRNGTLTLSNAALGQFIAASSIASQTTLTSNGTLNSAATNATADTIRMKVFVRLM